jgi:hypothetical protein
MRKTKRRGEGAACAKEDNAEIQWWGTAENIGRITPHSFPRASGARPFRRSLEA